MNPRTREGLSRSTIHLGQISSLVFALLSQKRHWRIRKDSWGKSDLVAALEKTETTKIGWRNKFQPGVAHPLPLLKYYSLPGPSIDRKCSADLLSRVEFEQFA
jgi:hypothetical protein